MLKLIKTNTICKLSEEDALDATLSQYSDGDTVNLPMELDKDPYLAAINLTVASVALQAIYNDYLNKIKDILIPRVKAYEMSEEIMRIICDKQ